MSESDRQVLLFILKSISILGLVAFCGMGTALVYQKLRVYYPAEVERHKNWFYVIAALMTFLFLFIFQRFFT